MFRQVELFSNTISLPERRAEAKLKILRSSSLDPAFGLPPSPSSSHHLSTCYPFPLVPLRARSALYLCANAPLRPQLSRSFTQTFLHSSRFLLLSRVCLHLDFNSFILMTVILVQFSKYFSLSLQLQVFVFALKTLTWAMSLPRSVSRRFSRVRALRRYRWIFSGSFNLKRQ